MLKLNYSQIKRIYDHIDFADDEVITSAIYDESDHELDCTIECNGQISAYCATLTQEQADAIIGKAKLTAKMLKALPKKIKAAIFASAVNRGFWDYFDQCKWIPHLHKYRYYCAGNETVYYVSQTKFAEDFDEYCDLDERKDMTQDYLSLGGAL